MVDELETLGERLKCDAVRSIVHRGTNVLDECLIGSGHVREATNFIKRLSPGRAGDSG
ncbi:MAG: hypothetical protein WDN04_11490 [Rhodospirillales bacterium]